MNKFEQRSIASYNKKAKGYDNTLEGRFTSKFQKELISAIDLKDDVVLLDVACGTGRLLNNLSKKATIKGAGVDISEKMVEQAKEQNTMMDFKISACDKIPFEDDYFDILTVCAAFHHFPKVNDFAKEAGRVVMSGGMVYIGEIYLPSWLRYICNPFVRFSRAGDVKFYAPEEIVKIFERNGFCKKNIIIKKNIQIVVLQRL